MHKKWLELGTVGSSFIRGDLFQLVEMQICSLDKEKDEFIILIVTPSFTLGYSLL